MSSPRSIGIIAGKGVYPETFVRAARKHEPSTRLVVVAFENETDPELESMVDAFCWLRVGQLSKLIKFFVKEGVKEAIMVGQITPERLFDLRPDLRILMMLARLKRRNAESLFGAISEELAKDGISILPATTFLDEHLPEPGHIAGPPVKARTQDDLQYGFEIAKTTSALDIGQCVVVRHGTVLAVEAFEGTNDCIRRGGELGRKKDTVLVKVSKPDQDFRFDVPIIGPRTIEVCATAGIHTIGIESRKTLILEPDIVADLCKKLKVSVHAL